MLPDPSLKLFRVTFQYYEIYCQGVGQEPVNQASFGKLIRALFPNITVRSSVAERHGPACCDDDGSSFSLDPPSGHARQQQVSLLWHPHQADVDACV